MLLCDNLVNVRSLLYLLNCYLFLGNLTQRHQEAFHRNPLFSGMRLPSNKNSDSIGKRFAQISKTSSDLIMVYVNNCKFLHHKYVVEIATCESSTLGLIKIYLRHFYCCYFEDWIRIFKL